MKKIFLYGIFLLIISVVIINYLSAAVNPENTMASFSEPANLLLLGIALFSVAGLSKIKKLDE